MRKESSNYFDLARTNFLQKFFFLLFFLFGMYSVFTISVNFIQYFVEKNLNGKVYNQTGERRALSIDDDKGINRLILSQKGIKKIREVSYYFSWAVDLYLDTPAETRVWFQPIFSLSMISILFGFFIATVITTILPIKLGYMRQKIEREIINSIDKIHWAIYGTHIEIEDKEISNKILGADLRKIYNLSAEWQIPVDDLLILRNALHWKYSSTFYKIMHMISGLKIYMRNHFTEKYSNTILGFVYIGAAFLIIIIGLRGLKFIPASEPSLVFFALGLEFSILITYAFTLMFSKPEEQEENLQSNVGDVAIHSDKQMEKLLRIFLTWKKKQ